MLSFKLFSLDERIAFSVQIIRLTESRTYFFLRIGPVVGRFLSRHGGSDRLDLRSRISTMKTQLPLIALLILFGCGVPAPEQQSQSPVAEPSAVTTASEFTGKVVKVIDGDTIDVLIDDKDTIRIRLHGSW